MDESHFVISEGGISSWKVDKVYWNPDDISSIMARNYKIELNRDTVNTNGYDCLVVLVPNNASTESTNVGGQVIRTPLSGIWSRSPHGLRTAKLPTSVMNVVAWRQHSRLPDGSGL